MNFACFLSLITSVFCYGLMWYIQDPFLSLCAGAYSIIQAVSAYVSYRPHYLRNKWHKLHCWWGGHDLCDHRGSGDYCSRCGDWVEWHEWHGLKQRIQHYWWYGRPRWLRRDFYTRCKECGRRFNRHTDACPPF